MPKTKAIQRAHADERAGKSPSTQAGEFVREEIEEIRKGKHGARSPQQAIAIGLSEARRAGVKLPPYKGKNGRVQTASKTPRKPNPRRSAATAQALKREPHSTVSHEALAEQTHKAAQRRSASDRHGAARKAAQTRASHSR